MVDAYVSLNSEAHELQSLLANIPKDNVIERMSLEARLRSVQSKLEKVDKHAHRQKARLTFRGKPVVDSHGIAADFGAKAANAFSEAFVAVAAGLAENLKHIGPLPNKEKHQLLITGTAIGSFGFEFELPPQDSELFPELAVPTRPWKRSSRFSGWRQPAATTTLPSLSTKFIPGRSRKCMIFLICWFSKMHGAPWSSANALSAIRITNKSRGQVYG